MKKMLSMRQEQGSVVPRGNFFPLSVGSSPDVVDVCFQDSLVIKEEWYSITLSQGGLRIRSSFSQDQFFHTGTTKGTAQSMFYSEHHQH